MKNIYLFIFLTFLAINYGWSQEIKPNIDKTLHAFENFINQDLNKDSLNAFIQTYIKPSAEKKESWTNYIKQLHTELSGAQISNPEPSGSFVFLYRAKDALAGNMVVTLVFEKDPPHFIKNLIGDIELKQSPSNNLEKSITEDSVVPSLIEKLTKLTELDQFSGAVLLARDGNPIFNRAYGFASKRYEILNDTNTRFNMASASKMFTAIAIAQLQEKGLLDFDTKIIDILPDYPNTSIAKKVTVHQLLTHTSGMGNYWNDDYHAQWSLLRNIDDYLSLFVEEDLLFEPGERTYYSNSGFIVLGLIIEKLSGKNYFDYIKSNIFLPLDMKDTDAYELDRPVRNIATGYTKSNHLRIIESGPMRNNNYQTQVKGSSAGGIYSTTSDILKFMDAIENNRLISEKTKQTVLEGKVNLMVSRYGYGFFEYNHDGHISYGHGGGSQGVSVSIQFFPKLGYNFVVLSNYDDGADSISNFLIELITSVK